MLPHDKYSKVSDNSTTDEVFHDCNVQTMPKDIAVVLLRFQVYPNRYIRT